MFHEAEKRGNSHSAKKKLKGDHSALEWFFKLEALDAFKIKYRVLMVKVHRVYKKWTIQREADKKLATVKIGLFP